MSEGRLFEAVDTYINSLFVEGDPILDRAIERSTAAGLPEIQVSPGQGKLIYLLAKMIGAERILEIGTLGGYSTVWLGRSLPERGELITVELEPEHARVARETLQDAGQHQEAERAGQPAKDRANHEGDDAGREQPHFPEPAREPAPDRPAPIPVGPAAYAP